MNFPFDGSIEATHANLVRRLVKDPEVIRRELTAQEINMWHAATGIGTESGELLTTIKKFVIYKNPLDFGNIIEELGDLEFYMEQLRQACNITREMCLRENYYKLNKRYPQGSFTDKDAIERKDKENENLD